jgi:exodeoxyribonuclease-3
MLIASWNVNSVKQRLDHLISWLEERRPELVCLQETKCVDEAFPREPIEALGYNLAVHGQKTFNGVTILSRLPFDEVTPRLLGRASAPTSPQTEQTVRGSSEPLDELL